MGHLRTTAGLLDGAPGDRCFGPNFSTDQQRTLPEPLFAQPSSHADGRRLSALLPHTYAPYSGVCSTVEPATPYSTLALAQGGFSVREACIDGAGGSITVQTAIGALQRLAPRLPYGCSRKQKRKEKDRQPTTSKGGWRRRGDPSFSTFKSSAGLEGRRLRRTLGELLRHRLTRDPAWATTEIVRSRSDSLIIR